MREELEKNLFSIKKTKTETKQTITKIKPSPENMLMKAHQRFYYFWSWDLKFPNQNYIENCWMPILQLDI